MFDAVADSAKHVFPVGICGSRRRPWPVCPSPAPPDRRRSWSCRFHRKSEQRRAEARRPPPRGGNPADCGTGTWAEPRHTPTAPPNLGPATRRTARAAPRRGFLAVNRPRLLGFLQACDVGPQILQGGGTSLHRLDERHGRVFDLLAFQLQPLLGGQGIGRDLDLDVGERFGLAGQPVARRPLLRAQPVMFGLGEPESIPTSGRTTQV